MYKRQVYVGLVYCFIVLVIKAIFVLYLATDVVNITHSSVHSKEISETFSQCFAAKTTINEND